MPNWCTIELTASGDSLTLTDWVAANAPGGQFSFGHAVPMPESADALVTCLAWGTKWDAANPDVSWIDGNVFVQFDTAWGPPRAWFDTMVAKWPTLTFTMWFGEPNNNFQGLISAEHGYAQETAYDDYWDEDGENRKPLPGE